MIDFGAPGPDRGERGKYLLLPPGYDGPVPEGGFFVARSRTTRVLVPGRSFMENNDPKTHGQFQQTKPEMMDFAGAITPRPRFAILDGATRSRSKCT